ATVVPSTGTFDNGGTVQFAINGMNYGSPVSLSNGIATISDSALAASRTAYTVTATYSGDTDFASSFGTLSGGQTVNPAETSTSVTSSLNPAVYGQPVTFTATVSNTSGTGVTPVGTVQFVVDGSNLGSPVPLDASGHATSP